MDYSGDEEEDGASDIIGGSDDDEDSGNILSRPMSEMSGTLHTPLL